MMKNLKYSKLFKNIGLLTIGNFASKLLVFFLIPIYTNVLKTEEYATADLVFTTVSLLYPIFSVLMSEAVMRFALDNKNNNQVFSIAFYITLFGTLILFVFSPLFLLFDNMKKYYMYFLVYYTLDVFNLIFLQFVKGINKVKNYVIAGIISTLTTILANILFLLVFKVGLRGYFISYILGQLFSLIYIIFSCNLFGYIIKPNEIDKKLSKKMLKFSLPMIPNSISWWISNSSDKYMLSYLCNLSLTGIYSVSYKIPSIITIFSNIFIGAWQISAVEDFGSEQSQRFYSKVYNNYTSFLIILISFLIVMVKVIARFLFAKDFYIAWECSSILLIATMFNSLAAFLGSIYTSAKKTNFLFYSTLIGAISNIVMNIILIKAFNAKGAALATLISYFMVWLLRSINSKKVLPMKIHHKKNSISFIILMIQVLIYLINIKYAMVYNLFLFTILLLINHNILKTILSIIKKG